MAQVIGDEGIELQAKFKEPPSVYPMNLLACWPTREMGIASAVSTRLSSGPCRRERLRLQGWTVLDLSAADPGQPSRWGCLNS